MELKKVELVKTETCLTYVLRRMGLSSDFCTYDTYGEHFDQLVFSKMKSLQKGDVLLWDKNVDYEWLPWVIDENGVRWKSVPVSFHFGIMEDEVHFSDCTRLVKPPHPSLRYRAIKDLRRLPDWVLRFNEG